MTRIATFIAGCTLQACAFGTRHVNLTYGPGLPVEAGSPRYSAVAVAPLVDGRAPADAGGRNIAKVRNGYGMVTASVVANQDPVLWVTEGVARTLAAQGFVVRRVTSPSEAPGIPTIGGKVMQTAGDMYMSTKADISAQLDIVDHGATVQSLVCTGTASNMAWTASAEEYRAVFEEAMTEFAKQCGPRLTGALTGGGSP